MGVGWEWASWAGSDDDNAGGWGGDGREKSSAMEKAERTIGGLTRDKSADSP